MKKILVFLLLAMIACATIEEDNLKGYDEIMKLVKEIQEFIQFVIQKKLNKQFIDAVGKGKDSAIQFCFAYYNKSNCEQIISGLFTFKDFMDKIRNSF